MMKRYFALSRTTHGVLDIAAPAACALLWLGDFPPPGTILLALFTAFAAYTAVYALNDLIGMRFDREKFAGPGINPGYSVEAAAERYPLAQSLMSVRSGLLWMGAWYLLALAGCWLLNPVAALILVAASLLEAAYCLLFKVTYLRTLVSGLVKTSGPIAAVFAVDRNPSPAFLLVIFAWLFFWEIGGQNIPADWNDTAEDRRVHAQTIPLTLGFKPAGAIVMIALSLTVLISALLAVVSPARPGLLFAVCSVALGGVMLLRPGLELFRAASEGRLAARLFDSASYYPLAQFALISLFLAAGQLLGA